MNPLMQNYGHIQALKNFIEDKYQQYFISLVSFTKRCTFKIEEELRKINSNELVIYDVELTQFINRKVAVLKLQYKKPIFLKNEIETIYNSLLNANITDATIRKQYIDVIKEKKNITDKKEKENKCIVCQKPVSDKVKSFCLSNKKFQGKIYCFEHQKSLWNRRKTEVNIHLDNRIISLNLNGYLVQKETKFFDTGGRDRNSLIDIEFIWFSENYV